MAANKTSVEGGAERTKRALITGITGQDGRHLAELLNQKQYEIYGLVKGQQNPKAAEILRDHPYVKILSGDLADFSSLISAVEESEADEVYNLGGISYVAMSFKQPELTANITGMGVLRLLEALKLAGKPGVRFYQASSSEMYGKVREIPQTERVSFYPRSPYGVAKVFGHYMTMNYRESYGMYACSGILFNHEGPRRGLEFVTRKITNGVAKIHLGLQDEIVLGNLEVRRDWGYAGDYVEAMWLMLQQEKPSDYVIATGEAHSIRDLLNVAFAEIGIDEWEPYVRQDPAYYRPAEVDLLIGDATLARTELGWTPRTQFTDLVKMMVRHDLMVEKRDIAPPSRA